MRAELEFDSFYAVTRPRLLHQLTIVTLDREQAADALQEAYVRAWQRWDRLVLYDDPEAWVRTVAYRRCVSHWRRLATARRAAPDVAVAESTAAVATAEVVAVRQALASLSLEHRAVLVLHEICDLSVEEIAGSLHVPKGTVKSRLARGRTALAALLAEPGESLPEAPTAIRTRPSESVVSDASGLGIALEMGAPDVVGP
jgi:RNA polymerase sigma-70 factor (ECF subfamily)